jgi:anaerobic selenocysteine-containing dehydrogenase
MADAVRTTCAYCGVGCGVLAGDEVRGDAGHPANFARRAARLARRWGWKSDCSRRASLDATPDGIKRWTL